MITSIYMANSHIQAVCGSADGKSASIKAWANKPLPEGTVINGVITNERALKAAIEELMAENPGIAMRRVRFVTGGNQIQVKRATVPDLGYKRLVGWIAGEFSQQGGDDSLVYDYAVLKRAQGGKGIEAMICSAQREQMAEYVRVLAGAGIKADSIDCIQNSQRKLVGLIKALSDKTFIVMTADGNMISLALYANGCYSIFNRYRTFSDPSEDSYIGELTQAVSSMIQFNHTERGNQAVSGVYTGGFGQMSGRVHRAISATFQVTASTLMDGGSVMAAGDGFELSEYIYAVGNLIRL